MILFGRMIKNTKYAWELSMFHKYREWKDGVDICIFTCQYDRYIADHNPKFELSLRILNFTIFEFNVYNTYHVDDEQYGS